MEKFPVIRELAINLNITNFRWFKVLGSKTYILLLTKTVVFASIFSVPSPLYANFYNLKQKLGVSSSISAISKGNFHYIGLDRKFNNEQIVPKKKYYFADRKPRSHAQHRFDWSTLPSWKGLPADHFSGETIKSFDDEAANLAARSLFDKAYTKLLVGDLDEAETGFRRILQHYPKSQVAYKAENALVEVSTRKRLNRNSNLAQKDDKLYEEFGSSIEQLSIISSEADFSLEHEKGASDQTPDTKDNSVVFDGVLKGSKEDFIINVGDRIFFEYRSASLTKKAKELLRTQADWLKTHKTFKFLIEAHSDENGSDNYNMTLSANRAGSVQRFFLNQGIDPDRIVTQHFGKNKPVAICKEEKCLEQNRRAVMRLFRKSPEEVIDQKQQDNLKEAAAKKESSKKVSN